MSLSGVYLDSANVAHGFIRTSCAIESANPMRLSKKLPHANAPFHCWREGEMRRQISVTSLRRTCCLSSDSRLSAMAISLAPCIQCVDPIGSGGQQDGLVATGLVLAGLGQTSRYSHKIEPSPKRNGARENVHEKQSARVSYRHRQPHSVRDGPGRWFQTVNITKAGSFARACSSCKRRFHDTRTSDIH